MDLLLGRRGKKLGGQLLFTYFRPYASKEIGEHMKNTKKAYQLSSNQTTFYMHNFLEWVRMYTKRKTAKTSKATFLDHMHLSKPTKTIHQTLIIS